LIIESQAPTRIDLAGGTIDLWPLYLFHDDAQTINFAIDQYAKCRVETRDDSRFVVESKDRNVKIEADSLEELRGDDELSLISKLICYFNPPTGLNISADCMAPAGAGLAGSSALNIAVCGALNKLTGGRHSPGRLPFIAINVETQVLKVPAGYQDYFPAVYGGVSRVKLGVEGVTREEVVTDLDELERRVALCFTGAPRNSGINNWEMYKRHIDNAPGILTSRAFDSVGAIFAEEWASRRELAPGITTPFIDRLIEVARASGAEAAKVCGAGGGGCVAFYCEPGRKAEVEDALGKAGGRIIPYRIAREGLRVVQTG
jgi:D-glycero-alpha-D-manno-heptose-7-phosphate kinase